ncbi:MAG: integration host factor subunit alpha [Alphaproteobacteria bacterium]|nr:integration host factor subunit alpha [Alphaproteobacteria bacterium]
MSLDNFGRSELIHLLIKKMGLNKQTATEMLDNILMTMVKSLNEGHSIKIPGFGTFAVREKQPRPGRNPRTGKDAEISARRVVTLRPSPLFKKKLDDIHVV